MHINSKNWNYTGYKNGELKAIIGMFAEPNDSNAVGYSVAVLEGETKEVSCLDFKDLNSAAQYINKTYSHWEFLNLKKKQSSDSGCDTCSAH